MPQSPGWAQLTSVYSATSGTTTLDLPPPPGLADGDILIMCLSHKGAGFATVPAGWTLIEHDVDAGTGIRGEMHWKRASGESGSYSVTGLADTALGVVLGYRGGKASGDVVDVSALAVNGAGDKTGPFTVTVPHALIVAMTAAGDNNIGTSGTHINAFPEIRDSDAIVTGNTAIGSDCGLGVQHAMMVVPGEIASAGGGGTTSGNVSIAVVLIPETGGTSGTRYYPAKRPPATRIEELAAGEWTRSHNVGMTAALMWPQTFVLSQIKPSGGELHNRGFSTNQNETSLLLCRFVTPPLATQTVSGTFDLNFWVNARFEDATLGEIAGGQVRYKVHIYITDGQSGTVRHVLADNVVDTADWSTGAAPVWTQLATAITLVAGDVEEGDSVCIELGAEILDIPTPSPTYPPSEWHLSNVGHLGTTDAVGLPYLDATPGTTTQLRVPWFDFSHTFVELATPASPPNTTAADAIDVTSWPYTSPLIDVSAADSPARSVWFRFTAPQTKRLIISTLGSTYDATPWIWDEATVLAGTFNFGNQADLVVASVGGVDHGRCDRVVVVDAQEGTTYYIRVHCGTLSGAGLQGQSAGGELRLTMSWHEAPAEDDLIVPAANIYRLRDGVIVGVNPDLRSEATTGIAIDASGASMADFNNPAYPTPTHTGPRLLIAIHDADRVFVLDLDTLNAGESEIGYIAAAFTGGGEDVGMLSPATLSTTLAGRLHVAAWGNGYLLVNGSDQLANSAYYNADSSNPYLRAVRVVDDLPALVLDEQNAQALRATARVADGGPLVPWHLEVTADGRTLYYVAGGWYVAESQIAGVTVDHRATAIKRFDLENVVQLGDFATVPLATGPREGLYGLAINPNGDVLVCNGPRVDRLNASGAVVQSYTFPTAKSRALVDVVWMADGERFWVYDGASATLFLVEADSGAILQTVDTYFWARVTTQIVVFQPEGITPPPASPGADDECILEQPSVQCLADREAVAACVEEHVPTKAGAWFRSLVRVSVTLLDHENEDSDGQVGYELELSPGSYAVTGKTLGTPRALALSADPGAYALVGVPAGAFYEGEIVLILDPGTYAVTGVEVGPLAGRVLDLAPGTYAVTGQPLTPPASRELVLGAGSYAVTGKPIQDPTVAGAFILELAPGSYAIAGQPLTPAASRRLTLSPGSYTVTGASIQNRESSVLVTFTASAEHASVTSYTVRLYRYAGPLVDSVNVGKPTPDGNNDIVVDVASLLETIPAGDYYLTILATSPSGSSESTPTNVFSIPLV